MSTDQRDPSQPVQALATILHRQGQGQGYTGAVETLLRWCVRSLVADHQDPRPLVAALEQEVARVISGTEDDGDDGLAGDPLLRELTTAMRALNLYARRCTAYHVQVYSDPPMRILLDWYPNNGGKTTLHPVQGISSQMTRGRSCKDVAALAKLVAEINA